MKRFLSVFLAVVMLAATFAIIPAKVSVDAANEPTDASGERFIDVPADAWYKAEVDYVSTHGIMGGAGSENTFKPTDLSTRAMIAVILHRLEGEPEAEGKTPFTDLKADWYAPAVAWAYENKIVNGSSATTFNPDGNITRQEIATMLCRYIAFKGFDTEAEDVVGKYTDGKAVADWAKAAVSWAAENGIMTGRQGDGMILLAPLENTQRCEMATIFRRTCECFGVGPEADNNGGGSGPDYDDEDGEPFFPATLEEILADIKSDRVKKVIFDADAGNEIDDQYALAYAIASEKMNVVSINASQFLNTALVPTREAGMMEGYNEIKRVLKLIGREDIPVYKGVGDTVTKPDDGGIGLPTVIPKDAEAVDNIINTIKSSNEIVYIMVTGCATNVACAIAKDPSIKDNMCVLWLGACFYDGGAGEFNFGQDRTAGRYMMNSGVKLIWLPAMSSDSTKGTQTLKTDSSFVKNSFTGSDDLSRYYGGELATEHDRSFVTDPNWKHTFWDVAAPAVFDTPELCELEIITLWRIRGDDTWDSNTKGRPNCIILNRIKEPQTVLNNMAAGINSFLN